MVGEIVAGVASGEPGGGICLCVGVVNELTSHAKMNHDRNAVIQIED